MSEYTIDELQLMLAEKIEEEQNNFEDPIMDFIESFCEASDLETEKVIEDNIIAGFVTKSKSNNKKFTEQRHYINLMENGEIVGRSVRYKTYVTGSYNDNLTLPKLTVIGEEPMDRTVLKG
tara:strand:- start:705 stop:1067 length:363 start_codon:yes stop_codon:yes gene_type:complete